MKMKRMLFKSVCVVLALIMALTMLSACSNNNNTEASVGESVEETAVPTIITIEADGKQITIEDAEGKNVQQLLVEAGITLKDGDVLSVAPDQILTGDVTIQVLRRSTVMVVVADEDPLADIQYTAVLVGGTVADAIEAVGVKLFENMEVNYELDKALEDGMEIIISEKEAVEEEETQLPEETETDDYTSDDDDDDNSSSSSGSGSGSSSGSGSGSGSGSSSGSGSGSDSGSGSGSDSGSDSGSESGRTVVSVEIYEDCDGSGHGVKVITYSDGTQEEVPF